MADLDTLVRTVAKALVLPPGGPLVLATAGLLMIQRWRRLGLSMAGLGLVGLYLLATPAGSALIVRIASGNASVLDLDAARRSEVIVIIGGGLRRNAPEYGGETLGVLTLERVRYGATLERATGLPVLVSGGRGPTQTRAEAHVMRDVLENEFRVPVRWVEDSSRNTRENAVRTREILHAAGVVRIVLVAHAFDMPRAAEEFTRAGFSVTLAPTAVPSVSLATIGDVMPSASALWNSHFALYELLAQGLPWLRS